MSCITLPYGRIISVCFVLLLMGANTNSLLGQSKLDRKIIRQLKKHDVTPLDPGPAFSPEIVELGQALFFDRELSGNRDTACATCHHPILAMGDFLALPVGTEPQNPGAIGLDRIKGLDREFIPRNAPEIFNRGSSAWTSQFWDSRVTVADGVFTTPAGENLLPGIESVLSAQAMFPVTSRDEMRGRTGDTDVFGLPNEMADVPDNDLHGIWAALMIRLLAIEEYQQLFQAAYPGKALHDLTFVDVANAIAAFESVEFTFLDSPWDRYVNGEYGALNPHEKKGAELFFGNAGCANCHNGPLLTDQSHYNVGVPQFGPGKAEFAPRDLGRYLQTKNPKDLFAFRTPPLRNVAVTAPYFHNGAYRDLKSVIRQHAQPVVSLLTFQADENLDQVDLWDTQLTDPLTFFMIVGSLDRKPGKRHLSDNEVDALEAFMNSLTAPNLEQRLLDLIPESVPSGLPVDGN